MKRVVLNIETKKQGQIIDVTAQVHDVVRKHLQGDGVVLVVCPHTTAGVAINESADPDVKRDFLYALDKLLDFEGEFHHAEGNSKAHVSSALTGSSQWIPVQKGKLSLGTWQSIWFCEFDGPRRRQLWVHVISGHS